MKEKKLPLFNDIRIYAYRYRHLSIDVSMKCKYNVWFSNRVDDIWSVFILTMIKLPRQFFPKHNIDFLIKTDVEGSISTKLWSCLLSQLNWCMNCKSITIRLHFSLIIKRSKGIHLKISGPNRIRHVNKRLLYRVSLSISVDWFLHKPCFTWFLVAGTMERLGFPIMSQ